MFLVIEVQIVFCLIYIFGRIYSGTEQGIAVNEALCLKGDIEVSDIIWCLGHQFGSRFFRIAFCVILNQF